MTPKKRKPRTADKSQPKDFGGYGRLKCRICDEAYTKHKTMDFCTAGTPTTKNVIDLEGRRRKS